MGKPIKLNASQEATLARLLERYPELDRPPPAQSRSKRKPKLPQPLERDYAKTYDALVAMRGVYLIRINSGVARVEGQGGKDRYVKGAPAGTSDRLGHLPNGRFLAIEYKRPGEWPTPEQIEYLRDRNLGGAVAFWVDGVDVLDRYLSHALAGGSFAVERYGRVSMT